MALTVDELTKQVEEVARLRAVEEAASRAKKEATEVLEAAESRMLEMLTESGLKNFNSPHGKVVMAFRTSVKTPKLPEDKEAFYTFLKSRGLYESLISVNSQTLNSLYKSEMEEAVARGEADFAIPGINEVNIVPQLRFSRS